MSRARAASFLITDTGWEILVFVMLLVFVLGFFFNRIEICLIVLPVFAPHHSLRHPPAVAQGRLPELLIGSAIALPRAAFDTNAAC